MNIFPAHSGWWVITINKNEEPFNGGRVIAWQGDDDGYSPILMGGLFDTSDIPGRHVLIGHEGDKVMQRLLERIEEREKHNFRVTNPGE